MGALPVASTLCGAFPHCWKITYDPTKTGSATSPNFSALIYGSATVLKDTAHGGYVNSSSGADVEIFSDACVTQVASEIDFYDNVNGVLNLWAQKTLTQVAGSLWVCVGNASPPARTTNPWDSNYKGVWHLPNGATLTANDSTGSYNGAISGATATAGQIDGGANFVSAGSQHITIGTHPSYTGASKAVISGWYKRAATGGYLSFKQNDGNDQFGAFYYGGTLYFIANNGGNTYATYSLNDTAWHYIVQVFDGTQTGNNRLLGYVDGSPVSLVYYGPFPATLGTADQLILGWDVADSIYSDGIIDEGRLSIGATRSPDWILAEYNSQKTPGNIGTPGFWTWAAVQ
jgi:hypothetical protein